MITALETGPGFFAADTSNVQDYLPPNTMRVYCARLEAYDLPLNKEDPTSNISFEVLFAMAEDDPEIARALLKLLQSLKENEDTLKKFLD